jgi:hypothetical protein
VLTQQQEKLRRRRKVWYWAAGAAGFAGIVLVVALTASGGKGGSAAAAALGPLAGVAAPDAAPPPNVDEEIARLVKQAGEGETLETRQSASDRLVALGFGDRVPRAKKLALDLQQAPDCEARLAVVEQLEKLKDPSTLTSLRAAVLRPGNDCLRVRAQALVDVIENDGEPPAAAKTPAGSGKRPSGTKTGTGARKKSTRGGHF